MRPVIERDMLKAGGKQSLAHQIYSYTETKYSFVTTPLHVSAVHYGTP